MKRHRFVKEKWNQLQKDCRLELADFRMGAGIGKLQLELFSMCYKKSDNNYSIQLEICDLSDSAGKQYL